MDKPERIATIKIFSDKRIILSDIHITKYPNENMYIIHDYISNRTHKIPYIVASTFILYMEYIKELSNINIVIDK